MLRTGLPIILTIILFISVSIGCSDSGGTPDQADLVTPKVVSTPEPTQRPVVTDKSRPALTPRIPQEPGIIYIGMMVHLEGWDDEMNNEQAFNRHADSARRLAEIFEEYDAVATFEARPEFVEGCRNWNDNVLRELYERGHGIGVHADVGGAVEAEDLTQEDFALRISAMKSGMEELTGVEIVHVSGICSTLDWVQAAAEAGYEFTTGSVGYCAMSLPVKERPEEYRFCENPGKCHGLLPLELDDRLTPWRAQSGLNWLDPDPDGRLVILPSDGVIKSLADEKTADAGVHGEFTTEDVEAYIDTLEEALSLARADRVNILYVTLSIGTPNIEEALYRQWLSSIEPYVDSGRVEWKTLPEMYNIFLEREEGGN